MSLSYHFFSKVSFIGAAVFLLLACSGKKVDEQKAFFEDKSITIKEKLAKVLETENLLSFGISEEEANWLQDFYAKKSGSPLWINDSTFHSQGLKMKVTLSRSLWFGVPLGRINRQPKRRLNWVEEEVITTLKMAQLSQDIHTGFLDFTTKKYKPKTLVSVERMDSLMRTYGSISWDKMFISCGVNDSNYRFLANHLYSYCLQYPMDKTVYRIKPESEDPQNAPEQAENALISKGYLLKERSTEDVSYSSALELFQQHNGLHSDGKIGKYTAIALNESTYNKILRACLSLDKIRQHAAFPKKFILINIPEYALRFVADDTLRAQHRIIVGKTVTPTPQLESTLRTIVVYPYWTVPYSICKNEILPAAKRSSAYFGRNNYKLYSGSREISPGSVNWKKVGGFPYKVVQNPGPRNSLGVIKFEFNNSYSVYVHDTPSKGLFNSDVRSYSHGCMRCEKPIDLAKTILDFDTMPRQKRNPITRDSLDTLLFRAKNHPIPLKYSFPIYVEYITVRADQEFLVFHPDIYRRDEEYLKILRK
jgi:hypothetical protein